MRRSRRAPPRSRAVPRVRNGRRNFRACRHRRPDRWRSGGRQPARRLAARWLGTGTRRLGCNVSKHRRTADRDGREMSLDLRHLRRDARTALELAVVALAPGELVDRLAVSAGLLEALVDLPTDSAPVIALVPNVVTRTRRALEDWQKW